MLLEIVHFWVYILESEVVGNISRDEISNRLKQRKTTSRLYLQAVAPLGPWEQTIVGNLLKLTASGGAEIVESTFFH